MGSTVMEWLEKPSLAEECRVSPFRMATVAISDEVSMAIILDMPLLYREAACRRIVRHVRRCFQSLCRPREAMPTKIIRPATMPNTAYRLLAWAMNPMIGGPISKPR